MNELTNYLVDHFNTDKEITDKLALYFNEELIQRNEFHTRAGSKNGRLSFVKSGFLRIYKQTDKMEVTQWISSPGEFTVDIASMMFNQPSRYNIQALTDCEIYSLSPENYARIQKEIPSWERIEKMFLSKCFMTMEDRILSFISMSTEERYHYFFASNQALFQKVPQQYIASILGMTPETFSRIRAKSIS